MKQTTFSLLFAVPALALIWTLYYFSDEPNRQLAIILTVNLVLYATLFRWLPNNKLQILLGSVAVTTGFYAFKYLAVEDYSTFNAVYSTFRLFLLDVDAVFHPSGSRFITYPLALEIARFSAAACTISTIFLLIFSYFGQSVKLLAYSLFGRHTVVIGYNRHSKILIENLCEQEQKVVLLTEDISDSQKSYLQSLGVIVFVGKQGEDALYKKCSLAKAEVLIIFYEDDSKNLNELLAIHNALQKDWSTLPIKQVIIHLTHTQSSALFDLMNRDLFQQNTITFKPFNLYNLAAHTILLEQPLYKGYEEQLREAGDEPFRLLFVGFGQTGKHMAIQAIEQCHFLSPMKLHITVLDQEAQAVQKDWYDSFPKSKNFVDIQFQSFNSNTQSISDYIQQASLQFTHVFICMRDDFQDLKEGITLAANVPNLPIYLKIGEEGQLSEWLHENKTSLSNLYLFGDTRSVLDYDHIINDKQEALAKRIHDGYRQLKEQQTGQRAKKWEEISDFEKESNRNQLHHAYVKLMLLGLRAIKKDDSLDLQPLSFEEYKELATQKLEALAASEHERWNTFHYIRGWDTLPLPSETLRDAKNKRHGCLVPYEELDVVSELFGQNYKQYDRDVVFHLYDNMTMLGYVIIKDA